MQRSFSSSPCLATAIVFLAVLDIAPRPVRQNTASSNLILRVTGAKNSKGQIAIALFNAGVGFPGDKSKALGTLQAKIDPQTLSSQRGLDGLPCGVYTVSAFHDENMIGQLDNNILAIPKEGYGASNNPEQIPCGHQSLMMRDLAWIN